MSTGTSIRDEELTLLKNIKLRRELLGYKQEYLAKKLGLVQNAYSRIETGLTSLKVDQLLIIAKTLNCTVADFLVDNNQ